MPSSPSRRKTLPTYSMSTSESGSMTLFLRRDRCELDLDFGCAMGTSESDSIIWTLRLPPLLTCQLSSDTRYRQDLHVLHPALEEGNKSAAHSKWLMTADRLLLAMDSTR